jgi:hypothetical protein
MATTRAHQHPIAAARWPVLLVGSIVLVGIAILAPIAVHVAVRELLPPMTAAWTAVAVAGAMVVALAAAWVMLRTRREHDPELDG